MTADLSSSFATAGAVGSFVCGSCAGVAYWVSIYPLDSVKSRVQVLSARGHVAGLCRTFWNILTTEGALPTTHSLLELCLGLRLNANFVYVYLNAKGSFAPDPACTARYNGASRRRFHTGIFHTHCIALHCVATQHRDAPLRGVPDAMRGRTFKTQLRSSTFFYNSSTVGYPRASVN